MHEEHGLIPCCNLCARYISSFRPFMGLTLNDNSLRLGAQIPFVGLFLICESNINGKRLSENKPLRLEKTGHSDFKFPSHMSITVRTLLLEIIHSSLAFLPDALDQYIKENLKVSSRQFDDAKPPRLENAGRCGLSRRALILTPPPVFPPQAQPDIFPLPVLPCSPCRRR